MNIIFKMALPCSKLVVANAQLGVAAYIHQANENIKDMDSNAVLKFTDMVMKITDRIHDSAEEGDYMLEVTEEEFLNLMCAVRCTFEMFISAKPSTIKEIISKVSDESGGEKTMGGNRRRLAHAAHIVLDFFECHAPLTLYDAWIQERKTASKEMLDHLASCVIDEDG